MKAVGYLKPPKKTVPTLTIRRALSGLDKKGDRTKKLKKTQHADHNAIYNGLQIINDTLVKMIQPNQQHKPKHNCNIENTILLGSGSTTKEIFMNPDLVNNINPSKSTLHISTNLGMKNITLQGEVKKSGDV